jgi:DNA-directed RNA polymerase specialized sigma24 family protein
MLDKETVIKKASEYLDYSINKYAFTQSRETKEDIKQTGFVRVLEAFERIDESMNSWKSYIQNHCNGAVLDYLKSPKNSRKTSELFDGTYIEADDLINMGMFYNSAHETKLNIKWDLVSRMAAKDDRVLLVARFLLGYTISDVSTNATMSRESITCKFQDFCSSLDDGFNVNDPWTNQIIYAFGLSHRFSVSEHDNGWGWDSEPINIFVTDMKFQKKVYTPQMDLI